ncbi:AGC/RSK protein kinase [Mycena sanguinolenta]|uniref:AGC/RSK protein kinase n=1 Tax=Mycena sanguinolenta TaxID=230812 RepID=A0A8H6Y9N2_9AGAR|nr:AGC/RSK protein kinase [Mycena sanguinolenta]
MCGHGCAPIAGPESDEKWFIRECVCGWTSWLISILPRIPPRPYHRDQYPYPMSHDGSSNGSNEDAHDGPPSPTKSPELPQKSDTKPQATFLTKLYALLERPENHHMIRWDPQGEHIVVERPEQLALHVLPSIYRQSRFASFSRQLNIYGFMRKVNLRNVDPAIDDPDASTWSHPTLNRHSPPEVVANFKRRVPPRLPKPRKRDIHDSPAIPPPRSAIGMGPVPLTVPSSVGPSAHKSGHISRPRGFSAPGAFPPIIQGSAWNGGYSRAALPPLTVPSDSSHLSHPMSGYHHSPHPLNPMTPSDDSPTSPAFNSMPPYQTPSQYPYSDSHWSSQNTSYSSHNGSLSSLLNPSNGGYSRPTPTINTSYGSPFSSMPMEHSASSMSPDSRPTTGYSMSSVSSLPYQDSNDYSRPSSSHHRPISPSRPHSSSKSYTNNSNSSQTSLGIVRRPRRHSQAMSPYPSPYEQATSPDQRPSTSPQPIDDQGQHHPLKCGRASARAEHDPASVRRPVQLLAGAGRSLCVQRRWLGHERLRMGAKQPRAPVDGGVEHQRCIAHVVVAGEHAAGTGWRLPRGRGHQSLLSPPRPRIRFTDAHPSTVSPDFGYVAMNEHLPPHHAYTKTEMQ